jgi:hypothetical protein
MALSKLFLEGLKKIPGLTFYDVGAKAKNKISLVFRYTDSDGNRKTLATKSFDPNTATDEQVQKEIANELKTVQKKTQKKGGDVNLIREQYTKSKIGFTDELINWLETNASNPKYKSPEQLLQAAEKAFNQPKYTQVPAKVDKTKVFFNKQRGFSLPREYQFYGKNITTKNPRKPLRDMAMVALLKSNKNPNFTGKKDLLMKYFARDPKSKKPNILEESKEDQKFLKNFSANYIARGTGGAGVKGGEETGSVILRFLKNEGANFENKLNEWDEIRRLETDVRKELQKPGLSQNRINFLNKTLAATKDKRINIATKLRDEYPNFLSGKKGDVSGSLIQEHKIARAIGEKSESFIPSTYLAKAEFTPAAFNLQKLKDFDTPLMDLIDKYNEPANKKIRPEIIKQIKALKKDFNLKSGGYLDDVDIQFGTKTVKLKDKTPFIFETSPADTYSQILKNIKHSNTYFKNKGVNEKIISGDTFNSFQKDLKTRISNQKGANLKSTLMGLGIGIPATSMTLDVLEQNPLQAAEPQQTVGVPEDIEFGDPETWNKKVLDFVKEYPVISGTAAGTTAVGGALATKTGRKALGTIGKGLISTPAGAVLLNLGLGVDPTETLDRTFLEAELAAAPALVKGAEAMTKNPLLQKALTLGISPRMANIMSGAGIAALAGEALYGRGKGMMKEAEKISAMESGEEQQRAIEEYAAEAYRGYAMGGRVGLKDGSKPPKMDRRMFMKIIGGIMSLPILGKVGKVAKPTVKALAKEAQAVKIPPYFFKLVDKIKNLGEDVTKRFATQEREVVYNYRTPDADYELIEDLNTGDKRIKVIKGDPDFPGYKEEELTLTKGRSDETTGALPDEYDEYTVRSDFEGKMKDIEDGIEDIDDLIEEVGIENVSVKDLQDAGYDIDRLPYELRKKLGIK